MSSRLEWSKNFWCDFAIAIGGFFTGDLNTAEVPMEPEALRLPVDDFKLMSWVTEWSDWFPIVCWTILIFLS